MRNATLNEALIGIYDDSKRIVPAGDQLPEKLGVAESLELIPGDAPGTVN